MAQCRDSDLHAKSRQSNSQYKVESVSLNDLLQSNNAPREIDYLSIDTEGSEFEILNAVDFDYYRFRVITCEHNYTEQREKSFQLLTSHGYQRKMQSVSGIDDWFVLVS